MDVRPETYALTVVEPGSQVRYPLVYTAGPDDTYINYNTDSVL